MSKRGVGAPSKLDTVTKQTLLEEIRLGASYTDAARVAGINPATVIGWRRRGERETRGEYFQFIEDLERARADRRKHYRMAAREIAEKKSDIKAIMWLASVTEPEEFSPKVNVFIVQQFNAAIDRVTKEFADDEDTLERVLAALAGQDGSRRSAPTCQHEPMFEAVKLPDFA